MSFTFTEMDNLSIEIVISSDTPVYFTFLPMSFSLRSLHLILTSRCWNYTYIIQTKTPDFSFKPNVDTILFSYLVKAMLFFSSFKAIQFSTCPAVSSLITPDVTL